MKLATAKEMKELDRRAIEEIGLPSIDLMERAAWGIVQAVLDLLPKGKGSVAVFCGSGNNGGDGIAAARMLFEQGVGVRVFLVGSYEKLTPDALEETRRLIGRGIELERFDPEDMGQRKYTMGCHVIIDAIFGVGLSREIHPESRFAAAVEWINTSCGKVVAADIASGIDADSGRVLGCAVKADKTVTFTLKKIGQLIGEGKICSGEVICHGIGIPEKLIEEMRCLTQTIDEPFLREALPRRREDGHKGTFGKLLAVGGAVGYTGAPYLTAAAAVRSGCGLVFLGVPEGIWAVEAVKCTSAMPFPLPQEEGKISVSALEMIREKLSGCDVLALGPGMGRSAGVRELVCTLLSETEKSVVLDADGINALEGHIDVLDRRRGRVTILTPHDGEFARIGGRIHESDRVSAARSFAQEHGCFLVLKGHRTLVATPYGTVLVNTAGNSGLAKGGSGDVLTGVISSLLAQGASAVQAAALGVWLHGRSGDLAAERLTPYGMTPQDVIETLPQAFREIM